MYTSGNYQITFRRAIPADTPCFRGSLYNWQLNTTAGATANADPMTAFSLDKQYAYYDVMEEYTTFRLKEWTPAGVQFVYYPADPTRIAFTLTADTQETMTATATDSYSNTSFIFRGRNSAILFSYDLLSSTQLAGGGFNFVLTLGFNIIHHAKQQARLVDFCAKIATGGFSASVYEEPIYEMVLGTSTIGIYHKINTCTAPETKSTTLFLRAENVVLSTWNYIFDSSTTNRNFSATFSFQKTPLSETVNLYYFFYEQSAATWAAALVSEASVTLSPGTLTTDSLKHGFGNIKKTVIPADYVSVFEYDIANVVTSKGGRAKLVAFCANGPRGGFDKTTLFLQNYYFTGNPPQNIPIFCQAPAYDILQFGCIDRSASPPAAIANCYMSYPPNFCFMCKPGFFLAANKQSCGACPAGCNLCISATSCQQCNPGFVRTFSSPNYICTAYTPSASTFYVPAYQTSYPSIALTVPAPTIDGNGYYSSSVSVPITQSGLLFVQFALNVGAGFDTTEGNYDLQLTEGFNVWDVTTIPVYASGTTYTHMVTAYKYNIDHYNINSLAVKLQAKVAFSVNYGMFAIKPYDYTIPCAVKSAADECLYCNPVSGMYTAKGDVSDCTSTVPAGNYMVPKYPGWYDGYSACSASCGNCVGTSINCTSCPGSLPYIISDLGDPYTSRCLAACPSGWFNDAGRCKVCHSTCTTCTAATADTCVTCTAPRQISSINPPAAFCYISQIANCQVYSNDNVCSTCSPGYTLTNNLCAETTQYNSPTAACRFTNPTPGYNCYLCNVAAGYYLASPTSSCATIPAGSFVSASSFGNQDTLTACDAATAKCANCVTSASTCTSCVASFYLSGTSCVATCPVNFGPDANNVCVACSTRCDTCGGSASNECVTCKANFATSTIGCNPVVGRFCCYAIDQIPNCQTPSADNICSVCVAGHTLFRGYCVPDAQLSASTACVYQPSPPNCAICNWDLGVYRDASMMCVPIPTGFVASQGAWGAADILQPCTTGCASCTGTPTNCQSCAASYFESPASPASGPKICITTCPPGYFGDVTTSKCVACDSRCQTCNGAQVSNCLTCATGFVMAIATTTPTCQATAPATCCVKCNIENCKVCSGDNICSTCADSYQLENNVCTAPFTTLDKVTVTARFDSIDLSYILTFSQAVNMSKLKSVSTLQYDSSLFNIEFSCFDSTSSASSCSSKIVFVERANVFKQDIRLVVAKPVLLGTGSYLEAQTISLAVPITYYLESPKALETVASASRTASTVATVSASPMLVMNGNSFSGFIRLTQTIEFLVYLNIVFPGNYRTFVHYFSEGIFDVAYNPFDPLGDNPDRESKLGWSFVQNDIQERYLMNAGQFVLIVAGCLIIKLTAMVALYLSRNSTGFFKRMAAKINTFLNLNLAFNLFESAFVDFVIASLVNLRYGSFTTTYDGLNYGLGILTALLLLLEMALVFHFSHVMYREKPAPPVSYFNEPMIESGSNSPLKGMVKVRLHKPPQLRTPSVKVQNIYAVRQNASEVGLQSLRNSTKAISRAPVDAEPQKPTNFKERMIQFYTWANLEDLLNPEDADSFTGRYKTFIGQAKAYLTAVVLVFTFEYPFAQVVMTLALQIIPTAFLFVRRPHKSWKENFKVYFTEVLLTVLMIGCTIMLDETKLLQSPSERYQYMGNSMIGVTAAIFIYAVVSNLYDTGKFILDYFKKNKGGKVAVLPAEPANFKESSMDGFTPVSRGSMLSNSAVRTNLDKSSKFSMPVAESSKFKKFQPNQSRLTQPPNIDQPDKKDSPKSPELGKFSTKISLEARDPGNRPSLKKSVVIAQPGPSFVSPPKSPNLGNTLHPGFSTLSSKPKVRRASKSPGTQETGNRSNRSRNDSNSPKSPGNDKSKDINDSPTKQRASESSQKFLLPQGRPSVVDQEHPGSPQEQKEKKSGFSPSRNGSRTNNLDKLRVSLRLDLPKLQDSSKPAPPQI